MMTEKGILPDLILNMDLDRETLMQRAGKIINKPMNKFGLTKEVLHERLNL